MTTTKMKTALLDKFGEYAVSQSVWLQTHKTTDIDELSQEEVQIIYYRFFPKQPELKEQLNYAKSQELLKTKRSTILTIATRIGLKDADSWDKFNQWMLKSSVWKKALKDYTLEELKSLEKQMRAAESNYRKSAEKVGNRAWYHKNKFQQPSSN